MSLQMLVGDDFPRRDTGIRSKSSIRHHPPANSNSCSKSLEEFEEAFSGRLTALVRAHDALFRNEWQPTTISALLHDALAPYLGERQVPLCIADIRLLPEQAFAFNLIIHELATTTEAKALAAQTQDLWEREALASRPNGS